MQPQNQQYPQQYPQQNALNNYPNQQNYNYPTAIQGQQNQGQIPQQYGQQQQPYSQQYGQPYQQQQFINPSPNGFQQMPPMKLPRTADGVKFPVEIECQYCQRNTRTRIELKSGQAVCCCSCVLLFTLPIFVCVPCCLDDQKDVYHFCTQCNHQVGFTQKKCCK